jgi:tRNA A64-2'-O-ribosylphosphate transferase
MELHTPPSHVSRSEHAQIEERIDGFVETFLKASSYAVDMSQLEKQLIKPIRPLWILPGSRMMEQDTSGLSFYPVVCLVASEAVLDGIDRRNGFTYVQGSADDEEAWSFGLTSRLFWMYREDLLGLQHPDDCSSLVHKILEKEKGQSESETRHEYDDSIQAHFDLIGGSNFAVGDWHSGRPPNCWEHFDVVINCGAPEFEENKTRDVTQYLFLDIKEGKKGQEQFYENIKKTLDFARKCIQENKKVLLHCMQGTAVSLLLYYVVVSRQNSPFNTECTGKDRSVGMMLCILLEHFTQSLVQDDVARSDDVLKITKELITDALLYIQKHRPKALPSRATMKKISTYFMSPLFL